MCVRDIVLMEGALVSNSLLLHSAPGGAQIQRAGPEGQCSRDTDIPRRDHLGEGGWILYIFRPLY